MSTIRLVRIALLGALLYVAQVALAFLPNIEIVSLLIVIFTLLFQEDARYICLVYVVFNGLQAGFGLWWWTYLLVWPLFSVVVDWLSRVVQADWRVWSFVLGGFGLIFGALFAIPYIFVISPKYALAYWIAGIPWDLTHGISNFVIGWFAGPRLFSLIRRAAAVGRW